MQCRVERAVQKKFCAMEFNDSQFNVKKATSQDRRALNIMEESNKLCDGHYDGLPTALTKKKILTEHCLCLLGKRLMRDQALLHPR